MQAYLRQVAQQVACNGLHKVEQRCSRWILLTHDRVGSDEFPLSQEFLSEMRGDTFGTASTSGNLGAIGHVRQVADFPC